MNPSTPPQRAPGARYHMCQSCKEPLTRPGETHLHESQCVKALKISNSALHEVLLSQSIRYAKLLKEHEKRGSILWMLARAAGGTLPVPDAPQPEGTASLHLEYSDDQKAMIVTANLEAVPATAPN